MPLPSPGLPFSWKEFVDSESPWQGSFGPSEANTTFSIKIDNTSGTVDVAGIPGAILGYPAYNSSGSPRKLSRLLPMRHPTMPWLWAAKILNMRGMGAPAMKVSLPNRFGWAMYPYYRVTIQFACPPFAMLDDATVSGIGNLQEFYRFLQIEGKSSTEAITKKGSRFRWAKVNGVQPPGVAATESLDLGIVQRVQKTHYKFTWHQVPGVALFGNDFSVRPTFIEAGVGKVNLTDFPAPGLWAAGTLLFNSIDYVPEDSPVDPILIGASSSYPPRLYRVIFDVIQFDPPIEPNYPYRGHNLMPNPHREASPYWYLATTDTVNYSPLPQYQFYQSYEFASLFQLP